MEFAISYDENLDNAESLPGLSGINLYLDVPKALLKVLKHFISAIRSLIARFLFLARIINRLLQSASVNAQDNFRG